MTTTYHRPWRYGTPAEVELDFLADRVLSDERLRLMLDGKRRWDAWGSSWQERVARLAHDLGNTYAQQVRLIIERAMEHVAERPHAYQPPDDPKGRTCRLCGRGAGAGVHDI